MNTLKIISTATTLTACCLLSTAAMATWGWGGGESDCDGLYDELHKGHKLERLCRTYCDKLDCPNLDQCAVNATADNDSHSADSDSHSGDKFYVRTKQCKRILKKFEKYAGDSEVGLPCVLEPEIALEKVVDGCVDQEACIKTVDEEVSFTYTITNAGDGALHGISLTDIATFGNPPADVNVTIDSCSLDGGDPFDPAGVLGSVHLDEGQQIVCTSSSEAVEGLYSNEATASALSEADVEVSAMATASYMGEPADAVCPCEDIWRSTINAVITDIGQQVYNDDCFKTPNSIGLLSFREANLNLQKYLNPGQPETICFVNYTNFITDVFISENRPITDDPQVSEACTDVIDSLCPFAP